MKKKWQAWQKVLVWIIGVLAVLSLTVIAVYKFVIAPKYIEPAAEKMQQILQNDENKQKIADIVVELEESGILDDTSVIEYLEKFNVENPQEALDNIKQFATSQKEDYTYEIVNADNNDYDAYNEQDQNFLEGENINYNPESNEDSQNTSSYTQNDNFDTTQNNDTDSVSNVVTSDSPMDKILKAASSEELETATKVLSKYGQNMSSFSSMGVDGMIDFMRENFTSDEKAAVMAAVIKYIDLLN